MRADEPGFADARKRIDLGKPPFAEPDALREAQLAEALAAVALDGPPDLKHINVALKALERSGSEEHVEALLARAAAFPPIAAGSTLQKAPRREARTLPFTVLFYEGPIARAYLAMLASENIRPARIVELVSAVDLVSRRPVGAWLPASMRSGYRAARQRSQMHHWPRAIARAHPDMRARIEAGVAEAFAIDAAIQRDAASLAPLEHYADTVIRLPFGKLGDFGVRELVQSLAPGVMLFTGGGLVPRALLEVPGARFIHVHPGHLPEIRGADCTLWSTLLAGRPSASSFYMAPGIDTGDVIETQWLPPVRLGELDTGLPLRTVYRAVYSFLDPWVRAAVLRTLVRRHDAFHALPAVPQPPGSGETYHFMAPALQRLAFTRLFS